MDDSSRMWVNLLIYLFFAFLSTIMLVVAWIANRCIKNKRNKYLDEQEKYFSVRISVCNMKTFPDNICHDPMLVTGCAVIANNYFVSWASKFRNFFGGRMNGFVELCTAARRLALVRMLQEAEKHGANAVYNVRFETSTISEGDNNKKAAGGVELIAYGTAVKQA